MKHMVTAVQGKEAAGSGAAVTATFDATPRMGNLLFAVAATRNGATDGTMNSSGWTLLSDQYVLPSDPDYRRSLTVWWKIAGASEATAVSVDVNSGDTWLNISEFWTDGRWAYETYAENNNGAVSDALSIATGTTGSLALGNYGVFAFGAWKENNSEPILTSWDFSTMYHDDEIGPVAYGMYMNSGYAVKNAHSGTLAETLTYTDSGRSNTGLVACLGVFEIIDAEFGGIAVIDAETGDLSQISNTPTEEGATSFEVSVTDPINGTYSYLLTFDGSSDETYAIHDITGITDIYARCVIKASAGMTGTAWDRLRVLGIRDGGTNLGTISIRFNGDGDAYQWEIRGQDITNTTSATNFSLDTEHTLLLHWIAGTGANGGLEAWVDGVNILSELNNDLTAYTADEIAIGTYYQAVCADGDILQIDDIKLSTLPIGEYDTKGLARYVDPDETGSNTGLSLAEAYASLFAAEADTDVDLVTANERIHINFASSAGTADTTNAVFAGATEDATRFRIVEAMDGDEALASGWDATRARLSVSGYNSLVVTDPYLRLIGLQIETNQAYGAACDTLYTNIDPAVGAFIIQNCHVRGKYYDSGDCAIKIGGGIATIFNTIVEGTDIGIETRWAASQPTVTVLNCTVYGNTTSGINNVNAALVTVKNSNVFKNGDDFTGTITIDNCASDDGDGTNDVAESSTDADWTDDFVGAKRGDFRLKSGSNLVGAGVADPGTGLFSQDMRGTERGEAWDLGAFESLGGTVVEASIAADGDDASTNESITTFYLQGADSDGNYVLRATSQDYYAGFRWDNLSIPAGATITVATIELFTKYANITSARTLDIYAEDADDPAGFTEYADGPQTRTPTTAQVVETIETTPGDEAWVITRDISPVIQEVVDRGGWATGQAIVIITNENSGGTGDWQVNDYGRSATYPAKLYVEYTGGGGGTAFEVTVPEGFEFGEAISGPLGLGESVAEGFEFGDTASAVRAIFAAITEGFEFGEVITPLIAFEVGLSEGFTFGDLYSVPASGTISVSVSEGFAFGEALAHALALPASVVEGLTIGDQVFGSLGIPVAVSDGVTFGEAVAGSLDIATTIAEGMVFGEAVSGNLALSVNLAEGLTLGEVVSTAVGYILSVMEGVTVGDLVIDSTQLAEGELTMTVTLKQATITVTAKIMGMSAEGKVIGFDVEGA